jgi:type IV pilus assembly protein PilO
MPDLRETRRKVKLILAGLGVLDVVAIAVFFSPLVGSELSRRAEMNSLWHELQLKTKEVEPLRGLDKKIPLAKQQIDQFYKDRLPAQDSAISETIGKLAVQNGVRLGSVKYAFRDPEPVGVREVEVQADLNGDYLQLVRFINALERDPMFFLVDTVSLGGEQNGVVKLEVKFQTYLKGTA